MAIDSESIPFVLCEYVSTQDETGELHTFRMVSVVPVV